ncbi:MAG: hypothetical protein K2Q22_14285, partial [Cytophagales bacterium]|nr:hypothetical protein [Cytophagales bacterium]
MSQGIFSHIPYIKNFTTSDYKAEAQNRAILQDRNGILYFGNGKGLLRFDGKNWDLIPLSNKSAARSMAMDANGRIYVGGQGDFGYISVNRNGITEFKSIAFRMPVAYRNFEGVSNVFCRGDEVIFHTLTGTYIYKDRNVVFVRPSILFQYAFQVYDQIYVNETGKGLMHLDGNFYRPVPGGEIFANERIDLMVPFKKDQILIFVRNKGVYVYSTQGTISIKKTVQFSSVEDYIGSDPVDDGKVLQDSLFAIATKDKGLILFNESGKVLSAISRKNGIINEQILSVYFDSNNNIWLGLEDGISFVSLQSPYTNYNEDSGLRGIVLCAIQFGGKVYIGTTQGIYSQPYENGRMGGSFDFMEGSGGECWNFSIVNDKLLVAHTNGDFVLV